MSSRDQSEEPPNKKARSITMNCQITEDEIMGRMILMQNDENMFHIQYGLDCFNISNLETRVAILTKIQKKYKDGVPLIIIKMLKTANLTGIDLEIIPKKDSAPRVEA
jgi:hypothetical protein